MLRLPSCRAELAIVSVCALLLGCDIYDATLLSGGAASVSLSVTESCGDGRVSGEEACDIAIPSQEPDACPTTCTSDDPCMLAALIGEGCTLRCLRARVTAFAHGDGCCPDGGTAQEDADCGYCGDSIVGPGEACDPPESCPTQESCATRDPCVRATLVGDPAACSARCELGAVDRCQGGDGCCPRDCREDDDSDCEPACGDGQLQPELGETCDPGSRTQACPSTCDDGDACTHDRLVGAAADCDATCMHVPITAAGEDGCCPPGLSAADDPDCEPVCGNGVLEADEDCDGDDWCDEHCLITEMSRDRDPDQVTCLELDTGASDQCKQCMCEQCTAVLLDCMVSGVAERDEACLELSRCGYRNDCYDSSCYCGSGACVLPSGPCRVETERAAGSTSLSAVAQCYDDRDCGAYRARAVGQCLMDNCGSSCER